jgi:hypothetical protein
MALDEPISIANGQPCGKIKNPVLGIETEKFLCSKTV